MITGPGGSGKPLVANIVVQSWLQARGSVIFLSLQYPDRRFTYESYRRVTGDSLEEHNDSIAFIDLDPAIDGMGEDDGRGFSANLVKPEIWKDAIERAGRMVSKTGPGVLLSGSALNLLLFSPTYSEKMGDTIRETMDDPRYTSIFSISSKPKEELVRYIVGGAGTVLFTDRPGEEFELFLEVRKAPGGQFPRERIRIPIPAEELAATREIAEHSRRKVIPAISAM